MFAKSTFVNRNLLLVLMLCISVTLVSTGAYRAAAQGTKPLSTPASELDASFAVQWLQLVYDRVQADAISAPAASRIYAYAGVTLYQAVVPGMPDYQSLSTQIKDMPTMPVPAADVAYDWPSVANAALATVMTGLVPKDDSVKAFADLRSKQAASHKSAVNAQTIERSLNLGDDLGKTVLGWSSKDNYAEAHGKAYTIPTNNDWDWTITTPGSKATEPYWGTLRPFGLETSDVCDVARNLDFSTDPSSEFYKQAMEVKTTRDTLTDEQKAIADFWVDTPGITGAPAGHWMSIGNQMVKLLKLKLDRAAEMYAMLGMVLGDSFISCWEAKYKEPLLRPVTYIKTYIKRDWESYIQSPPFPSYPSGHSVASMAAAEVLTALFGDKVAFTDSTHKVRNLPNRSFKSFIDAANEAAISRLYGGIHYRVDIENGLKQGSCVAQHVLDNVKLHVTK